MYLTTSENNTLKNGNKLQKSLQIIFAYILASRWWLWNVMIIHNWCRTTNFAFTPTELAGSCRKLNNIPQHKKVLPKNSPKAIKKFNIQYCKFFAITLIIFPINVIFSRVFVKWLWSHLYTSLNEESPNYDLGQSAQLSAFLLPMS